MSKLIYISLLFRAKITMSTFYAPPPQKNLKILNVRPDYHNNDIKYVKS